MSDLISRQDAIDALEESKKTYFDRKVVIEKMQDIINNLPSAQQWIPCSERLPEMDDDYLVTKKMFSWNCEESITIDIARFDAKGWHKADKILAWMPLPEPYKGGTQ